MKKYLLTGIAAVLVVNESAHAANLAMITSPPTLFSFFVMLVAGFCLFGSFQVLNQVRGGMLGKSWLMFFIGFILLVISQFLNIATAMEFFVIPAMLVPLLLFLMSGVFAYGVLIARKTLS